MPTQVTAVAPEERLQMALAQKMLGELRESGYALVFDDAIEALGEELGVPSHLISHAVVQLENYGLLDQRSHGFFEASRLAYWYEENYDRAAWRSSNVLRRQILEAAASAEARGELLQSNEGDDRITGMRFPELATAARWLHNQGFVSMKDGNGGWFWLQITAEGFDLVRDERAVARVLPRTATEDEEAHASVVPDVLSELIRDCDSMLERRSWTSALQDLRRGDAQHADGHWTDAVSEYYSAVESGLKHRLEEENHAYSSGAGLRDLAKLAVLSGLIPANYQQLFGFLDSVRSPRRHGRGKDATEVEVGPAETLLMANHARSLLVYLGHRPN